MKQEVKECIDRIAKGIGKEIIGFNLHNYEHDVRNNGYDRKLLFFEDTNQMENFTFIDLFNVLAHRKYNYYNEITKIITVCLYSHTNKNGIIKYKTTEPIRWLLYNVEQFYPSFYIDEFFNP